MTGGAGGAQASGPTGGAPEGEDGGTEPAWGGTEPCGYDGGPAGPLGTEFTVTVVVEVEVTSIVKVLPPG